MSQTFIPTNPDFERQVREGFARQRIMETFSAELVNVSPGKVIIDMPFQNKLTQHDGFLHAGVVGTIVDSACGFAAYSLVPPQTQLLTAEYKVNFLRPSAGQRFRAIGRVKKPGRTLTVCEGDVYAIEEDGTKKQVVAILSTMISVS